MAHPSAHPIPATPTLVLRTLGFSWMGLLAREGPIRRKLEGAGKGRILFLFAQEFIWVWMRMCKFSSRSAHPLGKMHGDDE